MDTVSTCVELEAEVYKSPNGRATVDIKRFSLFVCSDTYIYFYTLRKVLYLCRIQTLPPVVVAHALTVVLQVQGSDHSALERVALEIQTAQTNAVHIFTRANLSTRQP